MKHIEREQYRKRIIDARAASRIILLTGLRGAGKSTLLAETARALREERPPLRILQTGAHDEIETGRDLLEHTRGLGVGPSALFIDNADRIAGAGEALAEIIENYEVTVFITGRRTAGVERALRETFAPAVLSVIRINPLGYGDFLSAWGLADSRAALDLYCRAGGLPRSLIVDPASPDAREFTRALADSFLLTEIIESAAIRNPAQFRALLSVVARSAGESLSARQICAAFAAERVTISPQAALDYLALCAESGILAPVRIFDIRARRDIDSASAWYFGDAGLRSAFVPRDTAADLARAEENLAWLRLVDDGWTVRRGRIASGSFREDVTFVCDRADRRAYVQIIANAATAGERERKRAALLSIRDAWPRYLAAPDSLDASDGIRELHIRDLLLNGLEA